MKIQPGDRLRGEINVPGDKSVSHRALIFGGISSGSTVIHNFLESEDCLSTLACLEKLGIKALRIKDKEIRITGSENLKEPWDVLDCGNSGTTMRLLSGALAAQPFYSVLTGDASLRGRPMKRIAVPLSMMGAEIHGREGGSLPPLSIVGKNLKCLQHYKMPVASAQVKSCIILASLFSEGTTTLEEPGESRDHTERMLLHFGGKIGRKGNTITVPGRQNLQGTEVFVPGDFSSAAYFIAAGMLVRGSSIRILNTGLNPTRTGMLRIMEKMGAEITVENEKELSGEPAGDIAVKWNGETRGVKIGPGDIPGIIDEVPLIAVLASLSGGRTEIRGAGELRIKECDRLSAISTEMKRMGADITETEDGLIIEGVEKLKGADVDSWGDHRIAMSLAVAALAAEGETLIRNSECVRISFPGFFTLMESLR